MIAKVKIKIPIYTKDLTIVVSDDFDKDLKTLKINLEGSYNGISGLAISDITNQYVIFLDNKDGVTHSVIGHGTLHITHYILRDVGVVCDYDNDEAETYLLDFILEEIYKFLAKAKIDVKI